MENIKYNEIVWNTIRGMDLGEHVETP